MENSKSTLRDFFEKHPVVDIVRLHWVDYSGVLRTRFIPKQRALKLSEDGDSYSLAQNCMIIPISTAPDCFAAGPERWRAQPDWESLRPCGFNPRHAIVLCFLDKVESPKRFSFCPRTLLQHALDVHEKSKAGSLLVGFEIEFVLLGPDDELYKPVDRVTGFSRAAGLRSKTMTILDQVLDALALSRIPIHHFHTEVADQIEIAIAPLPPMEAIDALYLTQETIHTIFIQHGIKVSMAPRPVKGGPQNGCHMHLSLSDGDVVLAEHFIAGILDKMLSLCALGMANVDSYARVVPDGAGLLIGWGTENRDLPIRKVGERHWEFRVVDATSNAYLFLTALLHSGAKGIREMQPLNFKDCNEFIEPIPSTSIEKYTGKYGIVDEMPKSLRATLAALKSDGDLADWIGSDSLRQYVSIKEKEIETFGNMDLDVRRKRFLEYF
ncbi:glutamine synthetase [Nemania sp. FL0031]|nr:glutamine synthetase [Nemania sp. FL0031]